MPGIHHIDIWVADLAAGGASWAWLLGALGYVRTQEWPGGETWSAGGTYLTLTESPNLAGPHHNRRLPGVNHIAFSAGRRGQVDALMSAATAHGWRHLYQDRYPSAGGPEHYAGWLENAAGFKIELVAVDAE